MPVFTARDAANLLGPLFDDATGERLAVLYLGLDGERLALETHPHEGADRLETPLPVRAIIARALALDARALVIAHNHPSGDATPSAADKAATRRLGKLCEMLDIALHDHLIFAAGECESFRRLGLL